MQGDGDGWVVCDLGHRHWGRYGAAGLLLAAPERIVLQHRSPRTHEGDTWGLPGGARDSHEDVIGTALREAAEEAGIDRDAVAPTGLSTVDHGGWNYTTVVARQLSPVQPHAANWESEDVRWCSVDEVDGLPLHPGFGESWPGLRPATRPVRIVVDMANVVGAHPDGWWRDRAAANARLRERIVALAGRGLGGDRLPAGIELGSVSTTFPSWTLVVEGAASPIAADRDAVDPVAARRDAADGDLAGPAAGYVTTVAADGCGDDEIVARTRTHDRNTLVVTADRGLRARLDPQVCVGPQWLLALLDTTDDPVPGYSG